MIGNLRREWQAPARWWRDTVSPYLCCQRVQVRPAAATCLHVWTVGSRGQGWLSLQMAVSVTVTGGVLGRVFSALRCRTLWCGLA